METRANFVIIGAFTLLAVLAGLGFFLFMAKAQLDRSFAQYDVLFETSAGLGKASPVRFNGVDVGRVVTIDLDTENTTRVRVRIEVEANTPVRQGTVATLSSQGVTGVSFVALEGGAPEAERLVIPAGASVPLIPSKPSLVQGLIDSAPDVLSEVRQLLRDIREMAGPENRAAVKAILGNAVEASERLGAMMTDLAEVSRSVRTTAERIAALSRRFEDVAGNANAALVTGQEGLAELKTFAARLNRLADGAEATLRGAQAAMTTAQDTLTGFRDFGGRLDGVADSVQTTLQTARQAMTSFNGFAQGGLPQVAGLAADARRLLEALLRVTARLERDPARFFLGNQTPEYKR